MEDAIWICKVQVEIDSIRSGGKVPPTRIVPTVIPKVKNGTNVEMAGIGNSEPTTKQTLWARNTLYVIPVGCTYVIATS